MDYERLNALREGEQNKAEDDYFNAQPENDTPTLRKMFCNGFERGFHKGLKCAAPVEPVKHEPVALEEIRRIVAEYIEPNSQVDSGNLFWALCGALQYIDANLKFNVPTHHVRTKDLTDDEIEALFDNEENWTCDRWSYERAVIAADRAKNNLCGSANAEEKNK